VDSSKTLVQGRARGADAPSRGERAPDPEDPPTSRAARRADAGAIRAFDEREQRRGELLLGRYRLVERLGAGGFGTVWHAHDEHLDRPVALKRISLPGEEDRERATRESRATARLSHPAIVALYEATPGEDAFFLASELVEGDTLATLIAEDRLCDEEIVEVGLALVQALEHAHARGVVHRDVKPHNVLVPTAVEETSAGGPRPPAAKLADFGGASLAGDDALTRAGDVFGTLAYMAPEQSEGREVGPAADLYSLALVLYEAFSGVNPVRGRTPAATARRIGAPIEPLERRRRDLPRRLTRALDSALARDPRDRGTLADLHAALAGALDPLEASAQPLGPREEEPGEGRVSRRGVALPRLVWIGCLVAVAVWQAAVGRPGVSVLVLAAAAPLLVLPRRCGPGWIAAALAPALGAVGLAGAFPALAGQRAGWRARATLATLGFWWLALAEPLLLRRLWLGPAGGLPPRAAWEGSFEKALTGVLGATLTVEVLIGAAVWALAATVLPWIVRGRSAALDVGAAIAWTVALLVAVPLLDRALLGHATQPSPRGALVGAMLGCAVAVGARALRGPV
jgi:eukaryotic-like serine/threonine-protein kinase